MALLKKLKKGGIARWVLKGATSGDFFTVPRGFKILGTLTVENASQLGATGTLSLGKTVGVNDVYTITVTNAYTGTGTMTWGGGVVNAATVVSAAQATAIAALAGGATGAAQLAATAAVIALNQPTLVGVYGNVSVFNVTAVGATVVLTGSVPGAVTPAPTLSSTGGATFSAFVHTTTGTVDTTYMSPVMIPATTANSVSLLPIVPPLTSSSATSNLAVSGYNGNSLTATYTTTLSSTGSLVLAGQTVPVPYVSGSALTANQVGILMGGRSVYSAALAYVGSGSFTINGVSIASGGNIAATVAALNNAVIPGWIVVAATSTLFMCTSKPGPYPLPVFSLGGFITLATPTSQVGFNIPGYVNDSITGITNTVTFATIPTSVGVYAINGTQINIPYIGSTGTPLAAVSAIAAGSAWYTFSVSSSTVGTTSVNGLMYTASGTATTTAAMFATGGIMFNVPGRPGDSGYWTCYNLTTSYVLMVANTPGYMQVPVFAPVTVAAPVLTGTALNQGFTLNGYTSTYTGTTAVWVGPSPIFTILQACSAMTTAIACTLAGSTGSNYIYTDQNNLGANPPYLVNGTALGGTTYTQVSVPADVPYYLNFSRPELQGNVNVTMELEKYN